MAESKVPFDIVDWINKLFTEKDVFTENVKGLGQAALLVMLMIWMISRTVDILADFKLCCFTPFSQLNSLLFQISVALFANFNQHSAWDNLTLIAILVQILDVLQMVLALGFAFIVMLLWIIGETQPFPPNLDGEHSEIDEDAGVEAGQNGALSFACAGYSDPESEDSDESYDSYDDDSDDDDYNDYFGYFDDDGCDCWRNENRRHCWCYEMRGWSTNSDDDSWDDDSDYDYSEDQYEWEEDY